MTEQSNPIKAALDGWDQLHADHSALQEKHDQLVAELSALSSRYDILWEEHKRAVRERDLYQTYAVGLRTRLVVVKESILAAEEETSKWVVQEIEAKKTNGVGHATQEDDPKLPRTPTIEEDIASLRGGMPAGPKA